MAQKFLHPGALARIALIASVAAPLPAAQAQVTSKTENGVTHVTVTTYHPRRASTSTEYGITCAWPTQAPDTPRSYLIRVAQDRVSFSPDGDVRQTRDITQTRFGSHLLSTSMQGRYVYTCHGAHLQVDFVGFQIVPGSVPKPVSYGVWIANDGTIEADQDARLHDESLEYVNSHLVP